MLFVIQASNPMDQLILPSLNPKCQSHMKQTIHFASQCLLTCRSINALLRNEVVSVRLNWLGGSINSFRPRLAPSLLKVSGPHRMIGYDMAVGLNHDSKA